MCYLNIVNRSIDSQEKRRYVTTCGRRYNNESVTVKYTEHVIVIQLKCVIGHINSFFLK